MSMYEGIIEIGADGQPIEPILVLSNRSGNKIGVIQNVRSISRTNPLSDVAELSFDVYKEVNGEVYADWDKLKDFKLIHIPYDNTWFEAQVSLDEENDTVKHVTCNHANEAELGQLNLYETEINTEADIDRDDYMETFFYDEDNPKASLLHRILSDKAPHYQIYHVDTSLMRIFRQFSFNGTSIQDAFNEIAQEVGCLFIFGEWYENDGKYHRTVSAYDLEDYCYACGKRGNYTEHVCTNCGSENITYGYGNDTGIFISRENLATSISYETNVDDVKNCFRLSGGDDVMTAAIKSCNPNMSQYIWYFSDDMLEDMSLALSAKVIEYGELVDEYRDTKDLEIPESIVTQYNTLVDKYSTYNDEIVAISYPVCGTVALTEAYYNAVNLYGYLENEMMPSSERVEATTAEEQMLILQSDDNMVRVGISSASGAIPYTTANSAIQSYAKVFVDTSKYKVSAFTDEIEDAVWYGTITLKSYADDEDTATDEFVISLFDSSNNEYYADWVEQSVQKAMANREHTDLSIPNLFKRDESVADFKERLELYSLNSLQMIYDMAQSAIAIMAEQGIATGSQTEQDAYEDLYKPYLQKSIAVQNEIGVREQELSYLMQPLDDDGNTLSAYPNLGLLDVLSAKQIEIANTLNLQDFLGEELWYELSFYRREDEYTNSNYISDGLTDSEIIEYAQQFVDTANKEIVKSATLQHSISAPLANFLLMEEFRPLQQNFKVGNWIYLEVDGKVYKLRLTNWSINYDKIEDLDVEFSDVVHIGNIVTDVESVLSKSRSMATSYSYTARQADKGKTASDAVYSMRNRGVDFKQIKAIKSKGNTAITYDDDGILLQRIDSGETLPEQARIYNNGIYVTSDNWETVETGLGHYTYIDPDTGELVKAYGVIAGTVIGKLFLGNKLKIYSDSGKLEMADEGLKITAVEGQNNSNIFLIQKDTGEEDEFGHPIVEKYIYVDNDGDVRINGNSVIITGETSEDTYPLDDARKMASNYLSADSSGVMIADLRNGQQTPSNPTGRNILLTSNGISVRNNSTSLANFSDSVRIGQDNSAHMDFSVTGISAHDGTDNYYDVGSGSTLVTQTYAVEQVPLTITVANDIEEITAISINGTAITNYDYSDGEKTITIFDRPTSAITVSVTYAYTDNEDATASSTETFSYNGVSLTIALLYSGSTVQSVTGSDTSYTISGNNLVFSQRPSSGSTIVITFLLSNAAPYFTFNGRNSSGTKGSGSASFSNNGIASGESSFIAGIGGTASGKASFSSGEYNNVSAEAGSALGKYVNTNAVGGLSVGTYNIQNPNYLFSVGNGTSTSSRSNALTVSKNGDVSLNRALLSNGNKMFITNTYTTATKSVNANSTVAFDVSISKSGYTPICICFTRILGTRSNSCFVYRSDINITNRKANFSIRNINENSASIYLQFRVFFIATSALYG